MKEGFKNVFHSFEAVTMALLGPGFALCIRERSPAREWTDSCRGLPDEEPLCLTPLQLIGATPGNRHGTFCNVAKRSGCVIVPFGEWEKNPRLQAKTSVGP
jgi:hypothetical protein